MSAISERFRRLAAGFTSTVEAVPDDRWDSQSPCEDWTAKDVVRHMCENASLFFGFIGEALPSGPSTDDDPRGAWANARDALQAGLDDPAVAGREYEGYFGTNTFEKGVDQFLGIDLVVHNWDLAQAAGVDDTLDPEAVHEVFEAVKPMDGPMRESGTFGAKLDPPAGADEQTQLLAFLGRRA